MDERKHSGVLRRGIIFSNCQEDVIKSITFGLSIRAKIRENNGASDRFKSASFTATSDLRQ